MAIKQEEALELIKFLNLEEAADLEAAKEKFQENWIKQEEVSGKIGKLTGTIANVTRKAFEPFGIVLTDEDFKGQKVEEVIRNASERAKSEFEKQREDWEKRASGNGSEALLQEWEKKYKQLERKTNELDSARQDVMSQFESYKTQVATDIKTSKINSSFEKELGALKLDPSVNEYTIRGFKSAVTDKYAIDLEDDGAFVVKDKATGERLKSKEKAGSFLTMSDVLIKEATEAGIIQKNPHAGAKFPTRNPLIPQLEAASDKKLKGINPRFYQK
jgi:hypothetical protein